MASKRGPEPETASGHPLRSAVRCSPTALHGQMDDRGGTDPTDDPRLPTRAFRRAWLFPLGVLVIVAALTLLRLSGSSLGLYATAFGASEDQAGILTGPARDIRSDEWVVRTPWVLRQLELDMTTRVRGGMGTHDVAVLADLPTRSWEIALRPHLGGYLLLDAERAFALEWWGLAAIQLLGVYTLLYALTRRPGVAALASTLLTLSPATQWWWVPGAFTTIGYGCLATALVLFAHRSASHWRKIGLSTTAGWVLAAFLTTLYPPWQVGTAIVVAAVGVAAIVPDVVRRSTRRRSLASLAVVGGVAFGVAAVLFGSFLLAHQDTIKTISGTEYPGGRVTSRGGQASLPVLWSSAFDYFAAKSPMTMPNGTNQSENSSGVPYVLPVGLACFAFGAAGRLRDHEGAGVLLACVGAGAVLLAWMLLPIPAELGRFALLTRAPSVRLYLPLALASVLALGLLVAFELDTGRRLGRATSAVIVGFFFGGLAWGAGAYRIGDQPIDLSLALVFIVVVCAGVALALSRRPLLGLAVLVAFTFWQATLVNPLQKGTSPLTSSPLRAAIDEIRSTSPEGTGWVSFSVSAHVTGTVTASGVNHVTGVSIYPDWGTWRVLDAEARHHEIWNRYAHVIFLPGTVGSDTTFRLISTDQVSVTIDPCSPALTRLRVGFFVTQDADLSACATLLKKVPLGSGYAAIYQRLPPT